VQNADLQATSYAVPDHIRDDKTRDERRWLDAGEKLIFWPQAI
jgi:hypothetical protein